MKFSTMMENVLLSKFVFLLAVGVAVGMAPIVWADFTTPINNGGGSEPNLIGDGGILDILYSDGLGGDAWDVNLTRIDDFNASITDQFWYNPNGGACAEAKYAGYTQNFGYLVGSPGVADGNPPLGTFVSLFQVTGNGYQSGSPTVTFTHEETGNYFRFADDPSGAPMWQSYDVLNPDSARDHMVTWRINDSAEEGSEACEYRYVIAWEDLSGLGDQDYNDLVVEVWGVSPTTPDKGETNALPEPASVAMATAGLFGIILGRRRLRKNA